MLRKFSFTFLLLSSLCLSAAGPTQRMYLSGTGPDDTKTWDFYCSGGQHSGRWSKIQVPSCWELQGFGEYTYGRFYKTAGLKASDETGRYRTRFRVPKNWDGLYFRLTFEGVMTDAEVWIDGQTAGGIHQGGFTEFSYNVTDLIHPGKTQTLEVLVSKESSNASVNSAERRADWWLFGGIYRPVYLEAMPQNHIEYVALDARANGDLYADFEICGQGEVSLTLDGKTIEYDVRKGCFPCGEVSTWDTEHPNLHTAVFTLEPGGHQVTQRIGFRDIEFRAHDGIYLNGVKLLVKGTNRHCFHPETGRCTSKALSIEDARLIQGMNMNAVRCHYPSDRHFLEVCDSMGLLYLDEFPGWQTRYDNPTAQKLLPEFIRRDQNHPCVFIWSNGNEGGWNVSVDSLFGHYDLQHRKVVHPWADFEGIDTHHYPAYQTGAYRMHHGQNVFMPTEFLHGRYDRGQGASLEDMWNHWTESPLFAGGFIWAYVDEAVRRSDLGGLLDSDGGNGPDGVMNPYRQPEASYYTIREVWSPVYIDRLSVPEHFDGRIAIENRWLYTRLGECRMTYTIRKIATTDGKNELVLESGEVPLPDIAPGEKAFVHLPLTKDFRQGDILDIQAFAPDGREVCRWSEPIHRADESFPMTTAESQTPLEVRFNAQGMLEEISCQGKTVPLNQGPLPVGMLAECYRQSERSENGERIHTFWYKGGIDSIQWRQTRDGKLLMDAVLLNDDRGHGFSGSFLTPEGNWQIGLSFSYPESVFTAEGQTHGVRWLGRGPYRVWRNRLKGTQFGVWSKEYNNSVTGQYNSVEPPVYPEFKGYHAEVRWMEFPDFKVTSFTDHLYVRLYTPEEAHGLTIAQQKEAERTGGPLPVAERSMLDFPAGDLSFLLSIPPMRSYKPLEQLGPEAQPDNIRIKPGDDGFHIRLMFEFDKMETVLN